MAWLDWFRATYYLRISAERARIRNVVRGEELDEPAVVAIENVGGNKKVVAVGKAAADLLGRSDIELHRPFAHPRVPIGDFTVAEHLITGLVRMHTKTFKGGMRPSVRVLVHPVRQLEGGLTQIELRAFAELLFNAGARGAKVYEGPELADSEIDAVFRKLRD